jgi:hypothetical protein
MSWNTAPMMPRTSTSGLQGVRLVCTSERTPGGRQSAVAVDTRLAFDREHLATSGRGLMPAELTVAHCPDRLVAASRER